MQNWYQTSATRARNSYSSGVARLISFREPSLKTSRGVHPRYSAAGTYPMKTAGNIKIKSFIMEHHFRGPEAAGRDLALTRDISQDNFILRLVFLQCPDRIELSS